MLFCWMCGCAGRFRPRGKYDSMSITRRKTGRRLHVVQGCIMIALVLPLACMPGVIMYIVKQQFLVWVLAIYLSVSSIILVETLKN